LALYADLVKLTRGLVGADRYGPFVLGLPYDEYSLHPDDLVGAVEPPRPPFLVPEVQAWCEAEGIICQLAWGTLDEALIARAWESTELVIPVAVFESAAERDAFVQRWSRPEP
jgi:hypothetical protein